MLKNSSDGANLGKWSNKVISVICDYCFAEYEQKWSGRVNAHKNTPKDACIKCRSAKREETSLAKYGTRIPSQSSEIRSKSSKTKGGNGMAVTDFKHEIIRMFNEENKSLNNIADFLGITRSVLASYAKELGLDTTKDIEQKRKNTCLERYGVEHFLQCQEGQDKHKKSIKEKYGVDNIYQNDDKKKEIIQKSKETCLEKYGVEHVLQNPARLEEFENKRKVTRRKNGQIIYKDMTVPELAKSKGLATSSFYERVQKVGLEEALSTEKNQSYLEYNMSKWLDSLDIEYKTEHYIDGKVADFKIGDLLLELDGLYYHCDAHIKDDDYHVKKKETYTTNGFKSLFFRQDELDEKFHIVKSIILNKLGKSERIYARKCTIKKLNKEQCGLFFENNHLMGKGRGYGYGLFYEEQLVSAILICAKKGKNYEISRFCNILNTNVVGGFSKLISFVEKELNPESIMTYIDLRYGSGAYLVGLGFTYVSTNTSFKWAKGGKSVHRMKFPSNSGYSAGWNKIWDCGQAKFIKTT